jgi:UDP-N-acetylmuramoyl-tripeptide--D-alanyl-D-alanine ligase
MHELGPDSSALHKQIGKLVAELEIDHLVAIGNRDYLTEAHGSSEQFFAKAEEAEKMIDKFEPGDVLLIKASRAEHLDLLAEKVKNFLQSPTGSSELKGELK